MQQLGHAWHGGKHGVSVHFMGGGVCAQVAAPCFAANRSTPRRLGAGGRANSGIAKQGLDLLVY